MGVIRTYRHKTNPLFGVFVRISSFFALLRFNTTLVWHHKATRYRWYKKWHDQKASHHVHRAALVVYVLVLVLTVALNSLVPSQKALASSEAITYNSQSDFNLGTYSSTTSVSAGSVRLGVNVGDGADGAIAIAANKNINSDFIAAGRTCADGVNYSITTLTSNTATVTPTPAAGCLAAGDEVLILNQQGTATYYSNVGNYETLDVLSVDSAVITFASAKTKYFGNGSSDDTNIGTAATNQRVLLQRVPNYTNVTVNATYTLSTTAWNGTKGGVLFFRANGAVTVTGTISADSAGYRAGAGSSVNSGGGYGGEAYGALVSGGNGGLYNANGTNGAFGGGGGGGSNVETQVAYLGGTGSVGFGGAGGGGGGTNGSCNIGYGGSGGGGGFGGYGGSTNYPGDINGSGNGANGYVGGSCYGGFAGGGGGGAYGSADLSKLFLGSGGAGAGAGRQGSTNFWGTAGGKGGGIVGIFGNTVTVSGIVSALGQNGVGATGLFMASGGGGSGGSVILSGNNLTLGTSKIKSTGGAGGTKTTHGPQGGSGGAGRIAVNSESVSGTSDPAAATNAATNYLSTGSWTSPMISPAGLYGSWGALAYSKSDASNGGPTGTSVTVSVLDGANNIVNGYTDVANGTSLAGLSTTTYPTLKIRVNFLTSDISSTPLLNEVSVGYSQDLLPPTGTTLNLGSVGATSAIATGANAADGESDLRADGLTYFIERDNNSTTFTSSDASSGWTSGIWSQSSLSPNAHYSYRVKSRDAAGNESSWVTPSPAYITTLTTAPILSAPSVVSSTRIDLAWSAPVGGVDHYHLYRGDNKIEVPTGTTYSDTGLEANTPYSYYVAGMNGADGVGAEGDVSATLSEYTLAVSPSASSDKSANIWHDTASVIFTNDATFGAGGIEYYRYVWDQVATHTWTESETQWTAGTLSRNMVSGSNYLHLRTYNADDVSSGTLNLGPYKYDGTGPTGSIAINAGNYTNNNLVTLNLSAADAGSGIDQMRFSNSGAPLEWTAWQNFNTTKAGWDLTHALYGGDSSQGSKTVYVEFSDLAGNTAGYSDAIFWDEVAPTNPELTAGRSTAGQTDPNLTSSGWYNYPAPKFDWSGAADAGPASGVKG